jgi:hypothetical protein
MQLKGLWKRLEWDPSQSHTYAANISINLKRWKKLYTASSPVSNQNKRRESHWKSHMVKSQQTNALNTL